tara:strand:- start:1446 stop:2255 length:810 start_codon:yes stop_codon:yes gene_type:complete
MARTTYADRLKALIANPAVSARDCQFAGSLLAYYVKRKTLTAGRARCVRELEQRYSAEAVADREKTAGPLRGRLQTLTGRVTEGSWAGGFVQSLTEQVASGRNLSPRQFEILEKIEGEHSDEAINAAASWDSDFSDDMRVRLTTAARYYRRTGYFTNLVDRALTPDGQPTAFIPTEKQYRKITENKYAQKVLAAHFETPKYTAGSMVQLRPSCGYLARSKAGDKPCVVISTSEPIVSACKGAKMYRILPIGSATMITIEERHLKKARGV